MKAVNRVNKRDFYYFDGIHKVRIYGIREFILADEHKNNPMMIKRTKNWIQVKIHFLGMSYEWINISRYELMMFNESEKKLDSLLGKCYYQLQERNREKQLRIEKETK